MRSLGTRTNIRDAKLSATSIGRDFSGTKFWKLKFDFKNVFLFSQKLKTFYQYRTITFTLTKKLSLRNRSLNFTCLHRAGIQLLWSFWSLLLRWWWWWWWWWWWCRGRWGGDRFGHFSKWFFSSLHSAPA